MGTHPAPRIYAPRHHAPRVFALGQMAMTALLPNGPVEASDPGFYLTRGFDGVAARAALTESGALPLVPTAQGARRRIEEGTTNIPTNPIVGIDTTGWVTSHVIERVLVADEGLPPLPDGLASKVTHCIKVTFDGVTKSTAARIAVSVTDVDHAFSAYILITSGYTPTANVRLERSGYAGATGTTFVAADNSIVDQWQRPGLVFNPDAGDLDGNLRVNVDGADTPSAGEIIYIVGAQAEPKSYVTSLAVGSFGIGYVWTGAAHASASTRTASDVAVDAGVLDETLFGFMTWVRLPFANTARTSGSLALLDWRDDADNRITLTYDLANNRFDLARLSGGVGVPHTFDATFAAGDDVFVAGGGDATGLSLSADGAALTTLADANIPTLAAPTFDLGHIAGASHLNGMPGPDYLLDRVPTQAEIDAMYRSRWVPMGAIAA